MALKSLNVVIGADTSGYDRGLKRVQAGLSSLKSSVGGLVAAGLGLAGITLGLKGVADSMKAYAGLESSVMRVNDLFGQAAKYVTSFAENTAKGFGMAESTAYQYAATYGNLFRGITKSSQENANVTLAMLKASAVVASKTGRSMDDVNERIRSGILGSTEAIEDLGINVNVAMIETTDAFKRIADGRPWEKLTFQEQQQIRVLAILEQAHKNYGDSVQQSSAYSLQSLGAAFKDLVSYAGLFVNAGLQPVIRGLTQVVQWATAGLKALAALLGLKVNTGDAVKNTEQQVAAQDDLTDAVKETGQAAKQSSASFDVFNDITPAASDGAGAAGGSAAGLAGDSPFAGISAPDFQISAPDTSWTDTLMGKFEQLKSSDPFQVISSSLQGLLEKITPVGEGFSQLFQQIWSDAQANSVPFTNWLQTDFIAQVQSNISLAGDIIAGLGDSFLRAATSSYEAIKPLFDWFITDGLPLLSDFTIKANEIFETWFTAAKGIFDRMWNEAVDPFLKLLSTVALDTLNMVKEFWYKWGDDIVLGVQGAINSIKSIFDTLWTVIFEPIVGKALQMLSWLWEEHLKATVQSVLDFVGKLATSALEIFNQFIAPLVNWMITLFGPSIVNGINTVIDVVGTLAATIADIVQGVMRSLGGLVDFITGVFTGNWERAWQGVKEFFGGIWDGIKGIFRGAINLIIDSLNSFIRGLNRVKFDIPSWVPGLGGKSFGFDLSEIPKLASGGVAYGEVTALVGDNFNSRQDPEVISPLSTLKDMMIEAMLQKDIATGGDKEMRLTLTLENGETLVDMLIDPMNNKAKNLGYAPVFKPA